MFFTYRITILTNIVNMIILIFDTKKVNLYDFFIPHIIFKKFFSALPPSNGYIGIKLKIPIKILEYTTCSLSIPQNFILNSMYINANVKLTVGPASATINFFKLKIFDFFIF